MAGITKGSLIPEELVTEMFNNVTGHSALTALCASRPVPFNGQKEYVFSLDKEVDIVAENGAKSVGGATITPQTIVPIKFEYGTRVSDEFLYGSEAYQMNVLRDFTTGYARMLARGIDLAAFHGVNPRTSSSSNIVGDNCFDKKVTQTVTYAEATADDCLDSAVQLVVDKDRIVTGIAMSPKFSSAMAKIKVNGVVQYPEFRFGGRPKAFAGMTVDVNSTVSEMCEDKVFCIVGDFQNRFRWGYAKEIPLEIIEYGNPDNDPEQGDLKGHNQVYLRCETFVAWGIIDPSAFARIVAEE